MKNKHKKCIIFLFHFSRLEIFKLKTQNNKNECCVLETENNMLFTTNNLHAVMYDEGENVTE